MYAGVQKNDALDINNDVDIAQTLTSQWGFAGVTTGDYINLSGVPSVLSVADLNDDVPYPPEWAAYVLDPTRGNAAADALYNASAASNIF